VAAVIAEGAKCVVCHRQTTYRIDETKTIFCSWDCADEWRHEEPWDKGVKRNAKWARKRMNPDFQRAEVDEYDRFTNHKHRIHYGTRHGVACGEFARIPVNGRAIVDCPDCVDLDRVLRLIPGRRCSNCGLTGHDKRRCENDQWVGRAKVE